MEPPDINKNHSVRSQDSQLMLAEFNGYTMKVRKKNSAGAGSEKHGCESLMLYDQWKKGAPGCLLGIFLGMESYPVMWDYFIRHEIRIPFLNTTSTIESKGPRVFWWLKWCIFSP